MKIFCSGLGGIGISAYASLQKKKGHDLAGSDRTRSALLDDLASQGIRVSLDQSGAALEPATDLFVYSEAIPQEAPERKKAKELGIPEKSYPAALGDLLEGYRTVAVCGTHGKSSTTAITGRMLLETGKDPSIVVGTKMKELEGRNWREGKSDLFVIEACEYRRSFLRYAPDIVLFTTCDGDHFDYYKNLEDYRSAYLEFFRRMPPGGTIILHGNDVSCKELAEQSGRTIVDADAYPLITLQTPGLHMRQNAQLVLALADVLEIPREEAVKAVSGYAGSWRRMEIKGEAKGVLVIDDYGHHPAEIRATISAVRSAYPARRLVTVFQPHTHDRTKKLYGDFLPAFRDTDLLIIPGIYVARSDIESGVVDVDTFVKDIASQSGVEARNGISLEETEKSLRAGILRTGDVLLCMGAGTVTDLATRMSSGAS